MEEHTAQVVVDLRRARVQMQSARIEGQTVVIQPQSYVGVRRGKHGFLVGGIELYELEERFDRLLRLACVKFTGGELAVRIGELGVNFDRFLKFPSGLFVTSFAFQPQPFFIRAVSSWNLLTKSLSAP